MAFGKAVQTAAEPFVCLNLVVSLTNYSTHLSLYYIPQNILSLPEREAKPENNETEYDSSAVLN